MVPRFTHIIFSHAARDKLQGKVKLQILASQPFDALGIGPSGVSIPDMFHDQENLRQFYAMLSIMDITDLRAIDTLSLSFFRTSTEPCHLSGLVNLLYLWSNSIYEILYWRDPVRAALNMKGACFELGNDENALWLHPCAARAFASSCYGAD